MNEVVIRRSFLDRRKCLESTLRLNYEKDQEVGFTDKVFVMLNLLVCELWTFLGATYAEYIAATYSCED